MAVALDLVRIEFGFGRRSPDQHGATAKFVFNAKSDEVAPTTIEATVPWDNDLVAAEQEARKVLKDFGAGLG